MDGFMIDQCRHFFLRQLRSLSSVLALVGFILSISLLSGCQLGRFSMDMNREHTVPFPEMTVLPQQTEPELEPQSFDDKSLDDK
jgi:hypothetical protein